MTSDEYIRTGLPTVGGWFSETDARMFVVTDRAQRTLGRGGDLLEIGVFEGRSAILLGFLHDADESVHVCDVFEDSYTYGVDTIEVGREAHTDQDVSLSRATFDGNWSLFHDDPPTVWHGPSSDLGALRDGRFRLVHIDGGHTYEVVHGDIMTARRALGPSGIVVLDDYRTWHTPGVASAVWEAVLAGGMRPLLVTPTKLYGTWDHDRSIDDALRRAIEEDPHLRIVDMVPLLEHRILLVDRRPRPVVTERRLPAALRTLTPPALWSLLERVRGRVQQGTRAVG